MATKIITKERKFWGRFGEIAEKTLIMLIKTDSSTAYGNFSKHRNIKKEEVFLKLTSFCDYGYTNIIKANYIGFNYLQFFSKWIPILAFNKSFCDVAAHFSNIFYIGLPWRLL